jgi:protein TonB
VANVESIVALRPGSPPPRYPIALRAAGIEGSVEMRFVVDTLGRVEPGSATVLVSTDPRFTAAVEEALPRLRFTPARHGGRAVRMLVQMPFRFEIEER